MPSGTGSSLRPARISGTAIWLERLRKEMRVGGCHWLSGPGFALLVVGLLVTGVLGAPAALADDGNQAGLVVVAAVQASPAAIRAMGFDRVRQPFAPSRRTPKGWHHGRITFGRQLDLLLLQGKLRKVGIVPESCFGGDTTFWSSGKS